PNGHVEKESLRLEMRRDISKKFNFLRRRIAFKSPDKTFAGFRKRIDFPDALHEPLHGRIVHRSARDGDVHLSQMKIHGRIVTFALRELRARNAALYCDKPSVADRHNPRKVSSAKLKRCRRQ